MTPLYLPLCALALGIPGAVAILYVRLGWDALVELMVGG